MIDRSFKNERVIDMENRNNIYALIVAGGTGTRMDSRIPKQFLSLMGREMIEWSVHKFDSNSRIDRVIALVPENWVAHTDALFCDRSEVLVAAGGGSRNETIDIGLDLINEKYGIDDETIVLVHDAARPLVTADIIERAIDSMENYVASTVAVPSIDSVAFSENGLTISSGLDRNTVFRIQTPQTFRAARYKELFDNASEEEKGSLTESTRLFTNVGLEVALIEGELRNMKVTRPGDIEILETIYKRDSSRKRR